jgi:hypothetical protein
MDHTYVPTLQRVYDSYIMDHVLASEQFSDKEIREINFCWLFLQAVTVSNITNASGSRLFHGILRSSVLKITSATTWHHMFTRQNRILQPGNYGKKHASSFPPGVLHDSLEEWFESPAKQRRTWPFYFDPSTGHLLSYSAGVCSVHHKSCMTFDYAVEETLDSIPHSAYPVDTRQTFSGWRIFQYNSIRP